MRFLQTDRGACLDSGARLLLSFAVASALILVGLSPSAAEAGEGWHRIRYDNLRIAEVFRHALRKSTAFQDLVAALELADRVVYVEEGSCRRHVIRGCLTLMPTPGGKHILIRIAPRDPINHVAAQLAHELYHAAEIGREPTAVDAASVRALYDRIGERSCVTASEDCWETRAAVAFETLVRKELNGVDPWPRAHHRRD